MKQGPASFRRNELVNQAAPGGVEIDAGFSQFPNCQGRIDSRPQRRVSLVDKVFESDEEGLTLRRELIVVKRLR
jgi:hypothetical protein